MINKKIVICFLLFCTFALVGCDNKNDWDYFDATVIELTDDKNILVELLDANREGQGEGAQAYVPTTLESDYTCPDMKVGNQIRVYYNGEMLETAPLRFEFIYDIDIFDEDGKLVIE